MGRSLTLRWPRKCCKSLISRRARLAKIFLLKTLVTFLMATPSLVWLLTAALLRVGCQLIARSRRGAVFGEKNRCGIYLHLGADIPDDAVGALAKLLGNRVALVDDEVLVKDLEDLAALEICHDCAFRLASVGFRFEAEMEREMSPCVD
jgi:hypothetical protein